MLRTTRSPRVLLGSDVLASWAQSGTPLAVALYPGGVAEITQSTLQSILERPGDLILQRPIPQLHSQLNVPTVKTLWVRAAHKFTLESLKAKPEALGRLTSEELRHLSQYIVQELNSHCKRRFSCRVASIELLFLRGQDKHWYFLNFSRLLVSPCARSRRPKSFAPAPPCASASPIREHVPTPRPVVDSVRELRAQMEALVERQERFLQERPSEQKRNSSLVILGDR